MHILKYYEAIGLLLISFMIVQVTDLGNAQRVSLLHSISFPYLLLLSSSSFSPWLISRIQLFTCPTSTSSHLNNRDILSSMSGRRRYTIHELIHNTAGFCHHLVPFSIFVWIAMINFPLWFAQMDRAMLKKDPRWKSELKSVSSKASHNILFQQHPLFVVSLVAYIIGGALRGESYILSASGIVTLSLSFVRQNVPTEVALNIIPLSFLFVLEHHSVICETKYSHFIHLVSHFALHKATNDIYTHYIC